MPHQNIDIEEMKKRFPVPPGFRPLLEALAKEVLRGQPKNIYAFCALFFEKLMKQQQGNDYAGVIEDKKSYEKFKIDLFTEALFLNLVDHSVGKMLGIQITQETPQTPSTLPVAEKFMEIDKNRMFDISSTPEEFYDNSKNGNTETLRDSEVPSFGENRHSDFLATKKLQNDFDSKSKMFENEADFMQGYSKGDKFVLEKPPPYFSDVEIDEKSEILRKPVKDLQQNSDLYHHPAMGSLQRINLENKPAHQGDTVTKHEIANDTVAFESPEADLKFRDNFSRPVEDDDFLLEPQCDETDLGFDETLAMCEEKIDQSFSRSNDDWSKPEYSDLDSNLHAKIQDSPYDNEIEIKNLSKCDENPQISENHDEISEKVHFREKNLLYTEDLHEIPISPSNVTLCSQSGDDELVKILKKDSESNLNSKNFPTLDKRQNFDEFSEEKAAIKIQAGVRGYLTRIQLGSKSPTTAELSQLCEKDQQQKISQFKDRSISLDSIEQKSPSSISLDNPDLAATKIQAGVRGFLTRHRVQEMKQGMDKAAAKIQAGVRGHLTRKHLEKSGAVPRRLSHAHGRGGAASQRKISAPQLITKGDEKAAAKIQAGVRGYLTRKHLKDEGINVNRRQSFQPENLRRNRQSYKKSSVQGCSGHPLLPLPSVPDDEAAVKIQAGVRGYLTRKHIKLMEQKRGGGQHSVELYLPEEREPENPGEMDRAAQRIQAGVRGHLARSALLKQKEAALKIQAAFRGFHTRQEYADLLPEHRHRNQHSENF